MIRMWENGINVNDGSPSQTSVEGEESPLPQPTGNDRDTTVCEGPLLTALLNKMETLLDQVPGSTLHPVLCLKYHLSSPHPSPNSLMK